MDTLYNDYEEVKPLNPIRQEDFIWIYENISPLACESSLKSHHGKDASFHFANLEAELERRKAKKAALQEQTSSKELEACIRLGLVA